MRRSNWIYAALLVALAYWLLAGCAGVGRALDEGGEQGTAAAGGVGLGFLAWLVHPVGWVGAALAATGGAVGALLFSPDGTNVTHEAPMNPLVGLALVAAGVLLLRSWAHWLPPLLAVLKNSAKGAPRALLGGRPKAESKPNRFARRID